MVPPHDTILIRCETDHRLLARETKEGIWLYCRQCRKEQLHTWEALERRKAVLQEKVSPATLSHPD